MAGGVFSHYISIRMMGPTHAYFQFKGSLGDDVEEVLYIYVNVLMRSKNDEEKASSDFAYLPGDMRVKCKANFITGWSYSYSAAGAK